MDFHTLFNSALARTHPTAALHNSVNQSLTPTLLRADWYELLARLTF